MPVVQLPAEHWKAEALLAKYMLEHYWSHLPTKRLLEQLGVASQRRCSWIAVVENSVWGSRNWVSLQQVDCKVLIFLAESCIVVHRSRADHRLATEMPAVH